MWSLPWKPESYVHDLQTSLSLLKEVYTIECEVCDENRNMDILAKEDGYQMKLGGHRIIKGWFMLHR